MSSLAPDETGRPRSEASAWCVRLAGGELSLEEQIAFEVWLAEPGNRAAFDRVMLAWHGARQAADAPELIGVRADALEAMRSAGGRRWERRFRSWRIPAAAACLLLLLASALLLYHQPLAYQTGVGERRVVRLEDGSRVSLDAATEVEVDYGTERRSLHLLSGRARFDVAKDARRPFTVRAGGKMVVATGTSFSVEMLNDEMRVILYEGRVSVLEDGPSDAPPRPVRLAARPIAAERALTPGTELVAAVGAPTATVARVDAQRSLTWEGGQLSFADEPLKLAVERVNRYSDRKIVLGDAAAGRLLVSGVFNAGDTAGFIDAVTTVFPLRAREQDGAVALISDSPAG
ncbi:DUF4880 domain-containing protein [Altererythrobacter soli]|uniref:DUF4880 domain-containing protein n=1 Tax=Croceibacterium soli TaxID=1739690 RepID=A0A6I4UWT7_9SPHN|nr:FecR domain-containing protein [Croceibacterium soli]MXP41455.1 DUF4880 domain-containing protein [Croceibacterium soli]